MTRAVLDVGSNSVLLLVSKQVNGVWEPIFEQTKVTGLGRNTKTTGLLAEDAMSDTLAAIHEFFDAASAHGAEEILAGGTMALRIASNSGEFLDRALKQGTPVLVISGDEEAELGFQAVASDPLFRGHDRLTIIDPGGHSTELMTARRDGDQWHQEFRQSFSLGALGLRETVLRAESPSGPDQLRASTEVDRVIGLEYRPHTAGHAVVLGATGTNLISIREKLTSWRPEAVHGQTLDYEEIGRAFGWMCGMTDAERAAIPGIEKGREKTLHIGCLILERFLFALHVLECSVSVSGWRHALLERMDEFGYNRTAHA